MNDNPALILSVLLALGIASQWLAWFLKKPAIIFLLTIGIILGPTLGIINPDKIFGDLLFPAVSLGVAIILFEGALTLKLQDIQNNGIVVRNLVSIGVIVTIIVASLATWKIMHIDFRIALLFGALVSVTGPTVIVPLLRSVRPNKTISNILRWEGVIVDPIGALFVVLIYEYIIAGHSPIVFAQTIALGLILGIISALFLAFLLQRHLIPEFLINVFTLSLVLFVFSISNYIEEESGLLTVTVMGMVLANIKGLPTEDILDFKESLSIIVISMLFIVLSARIDFLGFVDMGFSGILVLLIIMFVARPLSVWFSAMGSQLSKQEKIMLSWIAPRGIVAAAVSSLFVLKLDNGNIEGTHILIPLVFTIIIGTVILQSLTAKPLANYLGVADPNPNGILICGINSLTIALGKALKNNGFDVILTSTSYDRTRNARMENLNVYYGNAVSEHADRHLNLVGIGKLLAMHIRDEQNMLTTLRYQSEFGQHNVYRLKVDNRKQNEERSRAKDNWESAWLFGDDVLYSNLLTLHQNGAQIKTTNISDNYSYQQYVNEHSDSIAMFAISSQGILNVFSSKSSFQVSKNWKVIALVPNNEEEKNKEKLKDAQIKESKKIRKLALDD